MMPMDGEGEGCTVERVEGTIRGEKFEIRNQIFEVFSPAWPARLVRILAFLHLLLSNFEFRVSNFRRVQRRQRFLEQGDKFPYGWRARAVALQ